MPKSVLSDRVDLEIPNVFEACIVFITITRTDS